MSLRVSAYSQAAGGLVLSAWSNSYTANEHGVKTVEVRKQD